MSVKPICQNPDTPDYQDFPDCKYKRRGRFASSKMLYFKNRNAKLEIAICRGKKQHDKRQDLIEKDDARKINSSSLK